MSKLSRKYGKIRGCAWSHENSSERIWRDGGRGQGSSVEQDLQPATGEAATGMRTVKRKLPTDLTGWCVLRGEGLEASGV